VRETFGRPLADCLDKTPSSSDVAQTVETLELAAKSGHMSAQPARSTRMLRRRAPAQSFGNGSAKIDFGLVPSHSVAVRVKGNRRRARVDDREGYVPLTARPK
jgi:hypothetical protein